MTFDPVAFANRGARPFQSDEPSPPPASSTRAGSLPSTTWKTSSCSAFTTLRVSDGADADVLVAGADVLLDALGDGLLAAVGVAHAVSAAATRTAEESAIAL